MTTRMIWASLTTGWAAVATVLVADAHAFVHPSAKQSINAEKNRQTFQALKQPRGLVLASQRVHVLTREFSADGVLKESIETPHLKLTYWASDAPLTPRQRVSLNVEIDVKPNMHVYAPGVEHYIPIDWRMADSKAWISFPVSYPPARMLNLPVIKETVPVFDGHFRMTRDIAIGQEADIAPALSPDRTLTVEGSFRYQACDDKECYLPTRLPLKWSFIVGKTGHQSEFPRTCNASRSKGDTPSSWPVPQQPVRTACALRTSEHLNLLLKLSLG